MTATEVTNRFGEDIARREPPRVQRHGRTAVVVVDAAQYDRLVLRAEANSTPIMKLPTPVSSAAVRCSRAGGAV